MASSIVRQLSSLVRRELPLASNWRSITTLQLNLQDLHSTKNVTTVQKGRCNHQPCCTALHQWRTFTSSSSETGQNKPPVKEKGVEQEIHPDAEREPLPEWPDGLNPHTGERGGPKGPEPTRYGDWERKGRVSDF